MIELTFVEDGQYFASGTYELAAPPRGSSPLETFFKVSRANGIMQVEGFYRRYSMASQHQFRIKLHTYEENDKPGTFAYSGNCLPDVGGVLSGTDGSIMFLGSSSKHRSSLSMHLEMLEPKRFRLTGIVVVSDLPVVTFKLLMKPHDPKMSKANVVSLKSTAA